MPLHFRRLFLPLVVTAILAVSLWVAFRPTGLNRPVKLGRYAFQARFTESVFNEIAKRRNVRIEWVKTDLDAVHALRNGVVDIWAAAPLDQERKDEFHATDVWTHVEMALLA